MIKLTNEQLERYSRHIILSQVGGIGQKKILSSKVLIIGTGELGSPAAMYLAAAGVGHIGLVDYDTVDLSNLQRQIIHQTCDVGRAKIESGRETINALNPDVQVHTYNEQVTAANIRDIIHDLDYDFIIDGTDNFPAKFLINDACVLMRKPFSHAGIIRFQGQTMTYDALTMTFRKIKVPHNRHCKICGEQPTITELVDYEQPTCSFGA